LINLEEVFDLTKLDGNKKAILNLKHMHTCKGDASHTTSKKFLKGENNRWPILERDK